MDELDTLLQNSFFDVYTRLKRSPAELCARLARRRLKTYLRPPRVICLSLRADDTRLAESFPVLRLPPDELPEIHSLTITAPLLARLSEPVRFPGPLPVNAAAQLLGLNPRTVRSYSSANPSKHHHFKTLDARGELAILPWQHKLVEHARLHDFSLDSEEAKLLARGKRRILVEPYPDPYRFFDPSAYRLSHQIDPAYGSLGRQNAEKLDPDFTQQLTRRSVIRPSRYDRFGNQASQSAGHFFLCPQCSRDCKVLYLPTRLFTLPDYLGLNDELARSAPETCDRLSHPHSLACATCHSVSFSRVGSNATSWNHFITTVTTGLLQGHEVPMPKEFQSRPPLRAPNRTNRNLPRDQQIIQLKHAQQTSLEIAQALHISLTTVKRIWAIHRAKSHQPTNPHKSDRGFLSPTFRRTPKPPPTPPEC